MAISLATNADWLIRTTGLVNCKTGPSTTMLWAKFAAPAAGYRTFWLQINDPATYQDWVGAFQHVAFNDVYGQAGLTGAFTDTTTAVRGNSTWFHITLVRESASITSLYINGRFLGGASKNLTTATLAKEYLGNDTFSDGGTTIAYCRQWSSELTEEEIAIEMQATSAVKTTSLWGDWPFTSTINDTSGNGRNWTQVGSGTFVAGPTFPSNNSAANAVALTRSDSITLNMNDGGYAWYSYTPTTTDEVVLGFWAFYDFTKVDDLQLAVFTGPISAPVQWPNTDNPEGGSSVPFQIPVTFGTTIYIQLFPHNIAATPFTSNIAISTVPGPSQLAPAGSIAVNDDLLGFPLVLMDVDTALPLLFNSELRASGSGCVMPITGEMLIDGGHTTGFFFLYDNQYALLTTIPYPEPSSTAVTGPFVMGATQGGTVFYVSTGQVADKGGKAVVTTYNATGSLVSSHTITAVTNIRACAANAANTILYYVTPGTNQPIKRWNLVTDVAMTDLVAGLGVGETSVPDLIVLTDDSVVVGTNPTRAIKHYSAAGALLHSYTVAIHAGTIDHLCTAIDDPVSIWVWMHNTVDPGSTFANLRLSDGTYLHQATVDQYEQGQYGGVVTAAPTARFGHSDSCPFWITRVDISPPAPNPNPTSIEYLIRRERWFPVVSSEQHRLFFHKLQLYFESGTGINDGQGSNPIVELDWSDDGGHTWSHLHLLESGPMGQKKRRIIQRMMGQSRERIYRVAVSDPVQWSLIDAFFDITEGTS